MKLDAVKRPLRASETFAVTVALAASAVLYCTAHALAMRSEVDWAVTLPWAVVMTVPFVLAVEVGKRVRLGVLGIGVACAVSIAAEHLLLARSQPIALELFQRLPMVTAGTALLLAVRPRSPAPHSGALDLQVPLAAVESIRSAGNYVEVCTAGGSTLVRATLNGVEAQLRDPDLVRIHRTVLVRRSHICRFEYEGSRTFVHTVSGQKLPVSASRRRIIQS